METFKDESLKYAHAKKQVKKIKGFYIHALIYIVVNIGLVLTRSVFSDSEFGSGNRYWTAGLWGIGLLAHGLSVFMPDFVLGKKWEEKKIQELMDKNK